MRNGSGTGSGAWGVWSVMRTALLAGTVACAGVATACALVSMGHPAALQEEAVIVVWDAKTSTQHFIRQPAFVTEADRLGFIVPTPTRPEVATVDGEVFNKVGRLADEMWRRSNVGPAAVKSSGVDIVETKRVGDWEATVLQADDGAALTKWLAQNGFQSRPTVAAWAQHYAEMRWHFTAFRYATEGSSGTARASGVRLSFATPAPFYPYRRPEADDAAGELQLAILATGPARAMTRTADGRAIDPRAKLWASHRFVAGWISQEDAAEIARMLGLEGDALPGSVYLTYFSRHNEPLGFGRDIEFVVDPPPKPGVEALVPLALGLAGWGLVASRWHRWRRQTEPGRVRRWLKEPARPFEG